MLVHDTPSKVPEGAPRDARQTPEAVRSAPSRDNAIAITVTGLLLLVFAAVVIWGMHDADADSRAALIRATAEPQTFEVSAGWYSDAGPIEELAAYFPDQLRVHRGDTIRFINPTVEDPHSVTFGLAPDRSNQPAFGNGRPLPHINGPCVSNQPLTPDAEDCVGETEALPPFAAQAFYNSGIITPGGGTFDLRFVDDLPLGSYSFFCVIHPGQTGTIDVLPDDEPTQRLEDVTDAAEHLLDADRRDLRDLTTASLGGRLNLGPATVQAGATTPRVSVNRFLPADITIPTGAEVTWVNRGSVPHVMLFNGVLRPAEAVKAPPTRPSGSTLALTARLFTTGPIGMPPYPAMSYSLRFTTPGTYSYICVFHPGMTGTVNVRGNPS